MRNQAIAQAHATGWYSLKEIADAFGLHYATISRVVRLRDFLKAKNLDVAKRAVLAIKADIEKSASTRSAFARSMIYRTTEKSSLTLAAVVTWSDFTMREVVMW